MKLLESKKGFSVGQMLPLGLAIVVLGITLSLGITVLSDVKSDACTEHYDEASGQCYTNSTLEVAGTRSDAFNGTGNATEGVNKFLDYLPTVALVIVVAVIIGILTRFMFMNS